MARIEEWSGPSVRGPGSGPMFSGGDGAEFGTCPHCKGVDPAAKGHFIDAALGHRPYCPLSLRPVRTADEALRRMEAFVRRLAPTSTEACEIVALLPEPPVDPDLIEARRLVVVICGGYVENIVKGEHDDGKSVRLALAALKRGRELASGESA